MKTSNRQRACAANLYSGARYRAERRDLHGEIKPAHLPHGALERAVQIQMKVKERTGFSRKGKRFYGIMRIANWKRWRKQRMWVCPKCKREFKRTNQGHYCGDTPQTVLEYIGSQPLEAHSHLIKIASIIRESVPNVNERIVWSMPAYENAGKSVSFSACKKHVSLYVGTEAIEKFASELSEFRTNKSAIYLPYSRILPSRLIETVVKWCLI